jgi:hemerythrin-like domain-containing protein
MARDDAVALLKAEHDEIGAMFEDYERLGDRALAGRRKLVARVTRALAAHIFMEEQVLFPVARRVGRELRDEVLEGLEEHHVIKALLAELDGMSPDDERYDAKVEVLGEQVEHHHAEEERDLFPRLRRAFEGATLVDLAAEMEAVRDRAPGRPDPDAPDEPVVERSRARTR